MLAHARQLRDRRDGNQFRCVIAATSPRGRQATEVLHYPHPRYARQARFDIFQMLLENSGGIRALTRNISFSRSSLVRRFLA